MGGGSYYTHVETVCERVVLPERATDNDDKVTCPNCLIKICEALRLKTERICAKIREASE